MRRSGEGRMAGEKREGGVGGRAEEDTNIYPDEDPRRHIRRPPRLASAGRGKARRHPPAPSPTTPHRAKLSLDRHTHTCTRLPRALGPSLIRAHTITTAASTSFPRSISLPSLSLDFSLSVFISLGRGLVRPNTDTVMTPHTWIRLYIKARRFLFSFLPSSFSSFLYPSFPSHLLFECRGIVGD
jgi:hypothetical protein